ncbi:UNVERIFIED_CONTAM: hypothetical protein Sradi_6368800 [Sesamum radiatum]|uniref:Pectinesterase inhibitor domain-containing protein n=1 Tax=Sesamum radiatum TaxID=300843 RepID=A0AAW2K1W9_SESRA
MADFLPFASMVCCLTSVLLLSTTAAAGTTELATQICRNTTSYAFCQEAMYSDPRAVAADRYVLAYIAYRQAYLNATDTADYIASELKSMGSGGVSGSLTGLRKCLGYYQEAIRRLAEMLGNLDSETFYGLDELSIDVENSVRGCEASVGRPSPLSKRNDDLAKLSSICLVVSKLYIYL